MGVDGTIEVIEGTPNHPFWSLDRNDWVPLGELEESERLQGQAGIAVVLTLAVVNQATAVYNIEVHGEHVYEVGSLEILVHNTCAPKGGFVSFDALKRSLGSAGEGKHWHHIVEQSKFGQFGTNAIHNVDNVLSVPAPIHYKITGFYNSIQDFTGGKTVLDWLNGQSFEFQRDFGTNILRRFGAL